jgi:exopolysaccharide production protein ExoZ
MEAKKFGLLNGAYETVYALPWGSGVDVFFIISGFIISHVLIGTQTSAQDAKGFLVRRIIRVVPVYWFYTLLMVIAMLLFSHMLRSNVLTADHVLASLFFIPWPNPEKGWLFPVLGQGWTLNYEFFFYILAFFSVFMAPHRRKYFLSGVILALYALALSLRGSHFIFDFFGFSIILEFIIGIWIYALFCKRPEFPGWLCSVFVVCALILWPLGEYFIPQDDFRIIARGVPAALLTMGIVFSRRMNNVTGQAVRITEMLGDSSYSLYLSHPFVLVPMAALWRHTGLHSVLLYIVPALVLCLAGSLASYFLIEKNLIKLSQRIFLPAFKKKI